MRPNIEPREVDPLSSPIVQLVGQGTVVLSCSFQGGSLVSEAESLIRLALSGIEWDQCVGGEQEESAVLGPHVDRHCQGRGGSL